MTLDSKAILAGIGMAALILLAVLRPYDDTDPVVREWWGRSRSGLALYTDSLTGCQYVKAGLFGGITPRIDERGRPICRK